MFKVSISLSLSGNKGIIETMGCLISWLVPLNLGYFQAYVIGLFSYQLCKQKFLYCVGLKKSLLG